MKKDRQKKTHSDAPPKRGGRFWLAADGSLRWWLKLLAALAAVLAAAWAVPLLLTALFQALFAAWGVNGETVARAPGWAQALFNGWLYINGLVQGGMIALAAALVGRALGERVRMGKGLWTGLLAGALAAAVLIALFRIFDVMRFGYALSKPSFSGLTAALTLYLLAQALGAALAAGLIGNLLSGWHRALGYGGCAVAYAVLFGRWTALGLINSVLFGLLLWKTREKKGGVAPAFGFLAAFSVLTAAVLGMPPWQQGALYETYHVSKSWLTGGGMGPWAGLAMTAILMALTLALALPNRRTKAEPLPRPARARPTGKS
jgi:hypothetical protein